MATSKLAAAAATKVIPAAQKAAALDDGQPVQGASNRAGTPIKEKTDLAVKPAGKASPATTGKASTALAERPVSAMVVQGVIDMESDAGMGLEGADKDSFALPFLAVLQGLSPQLKTVDGAKPGLIINTVTNDLYSEINFVPVAFQRRFNRWVPRSQGGGFKGTLTVAEAEQLQASGQAKMVKTSIEGKEVEQLMYEDTTLKDTRNHFVLLLDGDGGWTPALISLASTQIKRSKRLMALIQNYIKTGAKGNKFNPPSFARIYSARTESETNNKGTFESWVFEGVEDVKDPALYAAAKEFHGQIVSGNVVVAPPIDSGDEDSGNEGAAGKF